MYFCRMYWLRDGHLGLFALSVEDVGGFFSGVFQLQFLLCRFFRIGFATTAWFSTLHRFKHEHTICHQEVEERHCIIVPVYE